MSDLRHDIEKKGRRTMKLRKLFLLSGTAALAGCAHVDPNPAFRELANTVHLRTGKRVQWNRGTAQDAEAQAAVASLLRHPLTADATERSAETALRMQQAGNLKNLDLATEEASHAQAKIELAKAQSEAVQTREKLNKLMGAFGAQTNWTVASRLPELPGGEVSTSQLESRAIQLGPFQLLQAKQEEVKTGADSVEALRDYWVARAELEKAVGGSLSGKLTPVLSATTQVK